MCGRVFCEKCTQRRRKVPSKGYNEPVRVCDECVEVEDGRKNFEREHLSLLKRGAVFNKYHHDTLGRFSTADRRRVVQLSEDGQSIEWHKVAEGSRVESLAMNTVTQIAPGHTTGAFKGSPKKNANRCFSIISSTRTLDLEAHSPATRDQWVKGLRGCLAHMEIRSPDEVRQREREQAAVLAAKARERDRALNKHSKQRATLREKRIRATQIGIVRKGDEKKTR